MDEFFTMVQNLAKPGEKIIETLTPEKAHILHMAVGVIGEVTGELLDAVYSADMSGMGIDRENMREELGDTEFYLEGLRQGIHATRIEATMRYVHDENVPVVPLIGLVIVSGQLLDYVKKYVVYNKEMDRDAIVERLGAIDFYMGKLYEEFAITRAETIEANINKLSKGKNARYKEGYSDQAAQTRADKQ